MLAQGSDGAVVIPGGHPVLCVWALSVSKTAHLSQWVVEPAHSDQDTELEVVCQELGCAVERKAEGGKHSRDCWGSAGETS